MIARKCGSTRRRCLTAAAQRLAASALAVRVDGSGDVEWRAFMTVLASLRRSVPAPVRYGSRSRYCGFASRYRDTRSPRVRVARGRNSIAWSMRSSGSAQLNRKKPLSGLAETLAAQARDAEMVVGPFKQIVRPGRAR